MSILSSSELRHPCMHAHRSPLHISVPLDTIGSTESDSALFSVKISSGSLADALSQLQELSASEAMTHHDCLLAN